MKSFIICGYGIPEDIRKDQNYLTYLHIVFNTIFSKAKNEEALIIPCGGPTSCTPPYAGTEAESIGEYFYELANRESVQGATRAWHIVPENTSLSSLENIIFAKRIMDAEGGTQPMLFCEQTRKDRNSIVAKKVFGKEVCHVEGVDFDISKNRYLSDDIIEKKEAAEKEHSQWALESSEHVKMHHEFFEEKFRRLRAWQEGGMSHVDAVTRWYKEAPELLEEIKKKREA